jgi:hypothetical protein
MIVLEALDALERITSIKDKQIVETKLLNAVLKVAFKRQGSGGLMHSKPGSADRRQHGLAN